MGLHRSRDDMPKNGLGFLENNFKFFQIGFFDFLPSHKSSVIGSELSVILYKLLRK